MSSPRSRMRGHAPRRRAIHGRHHRSRGQFGRRSRPAERPMIVLRPRSSLHHVEGGWFSANWHFSFDTYLDPENTWFGDLRVFNDDRLIPGAVWPMHPHRDIEGITYVVEGSFRHQDDVGGAPGPLPAGSV